MLLKGAFCLLLALPGCLVSALWPEPSHYQRGNETLWISSDVQINYRTSLRPWQPQWGAGLFQYLLSSDQRDAMKDDQSPFLDDNMLTSAFERMRDRLSSTTFVPWKFHSKNVNFEPAGHSRTQVITCITVEINTFLRQSSESALDEEWYSLKIEKDDCVQIRIVHPLGGLRALDTLTQLFYEHSKGGTYTPFAPVTIEDSPAFSHRGINLDIARNWISPSDVIRTLDIMSTVKLNRLHLHAADAQSWPLEIPSMPDLANRGAYHPSRIWSAEDLKSVQAHGALLGIVVYLEIDLPGHTSSVAHAFPDLITAFEEEDWQKYSLEPPSGQLRLNSSAVRKFLDTLLHDLLPRTSTFTSFFHTGGDELNKAAYSLDPTVHSSSRAVIQPLLQKLLDHVHKLILAHSMVPIVWEEMVLDWNITLDPATIVQTWRNPLALAKVVEKGHRAIFGDHEHWYLDCGMGSWLDPRQEGPCSTVKPPYLDYCSPYKNWREVYTYKPLKDIKPQQRHLVLGGEVHLWGEMTDSYNLDFMLWPRAAAAAEVMWSGPRGVEGLDEEVTRRLADWRERTVRSGVAIGMVQMTWCLMHKGGCKS